MSSLRKGKIEKEIVLGLAILAAFLVFHRIISNKMLDETDKKE